MHHSSSLLALAASFSTASAVIQGMNVGSTDANNAIRDQANFQTYFATAKNLAGTNNAFTSARLYTMIQGGTTNTPTTAIPAAIAEGTSLLLGLWTSGTTFVDELAALKSAISTYGDKLGPLVAGISVGSEDLYRNSPTGIAATAGIGQQPDVIVDYISQVRKAIAGTPLSGATIGHVDTWTAWVNGSNAEVINACDWLGFDGYPYWQTTDDNVVANGKSLFLESYNMVTAVAGDKEVWVTETGWAVSDAKGGEGKSIASVDDAKIYWDDVGCDVLFGQINTYWYMLNDGSATPSFGLTDSDDNTTPLYNLTCPAKSASTSSSSSAASTATLTSSVDAALASESSEIASLSSAAATATGAAKSSILAQQTSISSAAKVAASSIASKASAAAKTSATTTSSSPSSTSSTPANGAGANTASFGGVLAAAVVAAWVL